MNFSWLRPKGRRFGDGQVKEITQKDGRRSGRPLNIFRSFGEWIEEQPRKAGVALRDGTCPWVCSIIRPTGTSPASISAGSAPGGAGSAGRPNRPAWRLMSIFVSVGPITLRSVGPASPCGASPTATRQPSGLPLGASLARDPREAAPHHGPSGARARRQPRPFPGMRRDMPASRIGLPVSGCPSADPAAAGTEGSDVGDEPTRPSDRPASPHRSRSPHRRARRGIAAPSTDIGGPATREPRPESDGRRARP